jgi:hypothetical protein
VPVSSCRVVRRVVCGCSSSRKRTALAVGVEYEDVGHVVGLNGDAGEAHLAVPRGHQRRLPRRLVERRHVVSCSAPTHDIMYNFTNNYERLVREKSGSRRTPEQLALVGHPSIVHPPRVGHQLRAPLHHTAVVVVVARRGTASNYNVGAVQTAVRPPVAAGEADVWTLPRRVASGGVRVLGGVRRRGQRRGREASAEGGAPQAPVAGQAVPPAVHQHRRTQPLGLPQLSVLVGFTPQRQCWCELTFSAEPGGRRT